VSGRVLKLSQFSKDLLERLADARFSGLRIPEEYDGQMADALSPDIACEETVRPDLALPHSIHGGIVAGEIVALCSV
jgi:alkylation response protein AidB-like acyl-CoA dehydrogenase